MKETHEICVNWEEVWSEPDYSQTYLAWPLVPAERLGAIIGAAKTGKSLLALETAACIASGRSFLGYPTTQASVLYIDMENLVTADIRTRLIDMGFNPHDLGDLHYAAYPKLPPLDTEKGGNMFAELLDKYQPKLVVLDTAIRLIDGKENENDTWNSFYTHTEVVAKKRKVAMLRIDHLGKDVSKGARGASAKYTDIDVSWRFTKKAQSNKLELVALHHRMPLNCVKLELELVDKPVLQHNIISASAGVAHDGSSSTVEELVSALDEYGAPNKLSQDKARDILRKELGFRFQNSLMGEVCEIRKARPPKRPKLPVQPSRPQPDPQFDSTFSNTHEYYDDQWSSDEQWDEDGNPINGW